MNLSYNNVTATFSGPTAGFGSPSASAVIFGGQLGARYYFTESIGAFVELGYGLANFNAGLAYKF